VPTLSQDITFHSESFRGLAEPRFLLTRLRPKIGGSLIADIRGYTCCGGTLHVTEYFWTRTIRLLQTLADPQGNVTVQTIEVSNSVCGGLVGGFWWEGNHYNFSFIYYFSLTVNRLCKPNALFIVSLPASTS